MLARNFETSPAPGGRPAGLPDWPGFQEPRFFFTSIILFFSCSIKLVVSHHRAPAWLAGLLAIGYLVLGVGMRRESVPPVLKGQLTVWVMYAIVIGLYVLALRRTRTLPFAIADPYTRPARRPIVTLAVAFTCAALAGSLAGAFTLLFGVALLIVGTATCAAWFVSATVRTLVGRRA